MLLTNDVYWEGETYFVDGRRFSGLLTQFFPIIGNIACGRTKLAQNAIVDLRLLRKPPPTGSLRIGYVRGPEKLAFGWTQPPKPNFVAGARVSVTGPDGSSIVETDSAGVYELKDLALGDYTLRLLTPEN